MTDAPVAEQAQASPETQEFMQLLAFVGDRHFAIKILKEEISVAEDRLKELRKQGVGDKKPVEVTTPDGV